VFNYMGLNKNGCDVRVKSNSKQHCGEFNGVFTKLSRRVCDSERMKVDNSVKYVIGVLSAYPITQGPQVVSEVHLTRWLDARKNSGHGVTLVDKGDSAQDI
jgi:hypothetical protein